MSTGIIYTQLEIDALSRHSVPLIIYFVVVKINSNQSNEYTSFRLILINCDLSKSVSKQYWKSRTR